MDRNKNINTAKDNKPTTSKATSYRVNSQADDLYTDQEANVIRISGASKNRLKKLMEDGRDYKDAKRAIIRMKFISSLKGDKVEETKTTDKGNKGKIQKRIRSDASMATATPRSKKARLDETSSKETLTAVKVAIIQE